MKKKNLKLLIFLLAGFIAFEAVSISVLFIRNAALKRELAKKRQAKAAVYKKPVMQQKVSGKIAIVLDDWGYNRKNLELLLSIKKPVTLAILPNLPFSKEIAKSADDNNMEVILHLPLEAHDSTKRPEKGAIYTSMSAKEALKLLKEACASVPSLIGVSNHMGSKATEDEKLMRILFGQLKKKNLCFLDSLVTPDSVCRKMAKEAGIKFAERSVFIDNENNTEYITAQLRHAIALAKERRAIVAIGHDRPLTIKAIKSMLAEFKREGIELVYLSEVVR